MDTLLRALVAVVLSLLPAVARGGDFVWFDGTAPVGFCVETPADLVVGTATDMFASDMEAVTGQRAVQTDVGRATIRLAQLDRATAVQRSRLSDAGVPVERLDTLTDGFNIIVAEGQILVTGSNGRGTAYGLLELSRMAGVSPWVWWGDVTPSRRGRLTLPEGFDTTRGASVEMRGIFLNDEDWSLRPWSSLTFEPGEEGRIGPRTYKEIFKLLMRLRANAVWPAMHPGTEAFFKNPHNKLVADSCGIAVGTSHCEPLLRNNVGEWDVAERGRFNYITNRRAVQEYWAERLREVSGSEGGNILTIGMRGIHDGSMEGVKTKREKFEALQQVVDDQQRLIAEHLGDPSGQMQVFVPYKEVLELYEMGLRVPEYVTLMWCDDNYGYITRLSTPAEQERSGGAGLYYHLSYWGRPHDYLWLSTTQPGLIYNELHNAWEHGVRKLWIANVHDPKVAAYDLELFLDLAWEIGSVRSENVGAHLRRWLAANFGEEVADIVYPAMRRFYGLTAMRRPEFMGWSQTELDKKVFNRGLSPVADTRFSFTELGGEADRYIEEYADILADVERAGRLVDPSLGDAWFAAVKYPVASVANQAVKMLEAQRARACAVAGDVAGRDLAAARSQQAYQNIRALTAYYNDSLASGKWRGSMDMSPRNLPAMGAPALPVLLTDGEVAGRLASAPPRGRHPLDPDGVVGRDAEAFDGSHGEHRMVDMLGHSGRAVELAAGSSLTYRFALPDTMQTPLLTIATIPTHAADGGALRYAVSVDGGEPTIFDLKEPFRSERWKLNVLRGQALRILTLAPMVPGEHTLTITALDPHIILDQWALDPLPNRRYYLLPTTPGIK